MSWDLHPEEMIDKASSLPVTKTPEVGAWHNFMEGAAKVAMQGFAKTARAVDLMGAVGPLVEDWATDQRMQRALGSVPATMPKTVTAQDRYFKEHDAMFQSAVDYWTPRPNEVGVAGEVAGSLLSMLPTIMASPALAVGATQLAQGQDLVQQGVDPGKAQAVGAVQALGLGAGIWMPILGTNALQRIVIGGAGFNVVQGVATRAASKAILEGDKAADQFRPLGGTELTLDILLGLAFGTMAHINPAQRAQGAKAWEDIGNFLKDSPPSDKAALATLREAQHINLDSLPGTPQTAADLDVHVQRMRAAIESLATDKPVDVENIVKDPGFEPAPVDQAITPENGKAPETIGESPSPAPDTQPRYNPDMARIEQDTAIREAIQEHAKTVAAEEGIPQIPDRKTIAQTIEEQLVQAGRPAEEAKAGATLWQAFFDTTASRYGRTGQQLFDRYMKGITGELTSEAMLAQKSLLDKMKDMQPQVESAKAAMDKIIQDQRELEGLRAAMRDPLTGKIYTGWSHQGAIATVPQWKPGMPTDGPEFGTWGRLNAEWDRGTDNTGFIDRDGKFISRTEAEKRWNVLTMEDVRDAKKKNGTLFQGAVPWYHSELERQIGTAKMNSASPKDWKNFIKGLSNKGVKADEVKWTGLEEWLDLQQGKVTKEQIQQYMKDGGVKVEEVTLGENVTKETLTPQAWAQEHHPDLVNQLVAARANGDTESANFIQSTLQRNYQANLGVEKTHGDTKFATYQLPGGENYRELLLTLPGQSPTMPDGWSVQPMEKPTDMRQSITDEWDAWLQENNISAKWNPGDVPKGDWARLSEDAQRFAYEIGERWWEAVKNNEQRYTLVGPDGSGRILQSTAKSIADAEKLAIEELQRTGEIPKKQQFNSSHFDQPNILSHIRFNERTDADGKRVLFIEEIQSDWAQKGKKEGFAGRSYAEVEKELSDVNKERSRLLQEAADLPDSEMQKFKEMNQRIKELGDKATALDTEARELTGKTQVPSAPFVGKTEAWVGLSLKRMIRYAAENGFDRVAWTNGEQQAARYDLSKQVDRIDYFKRDDGQYDIEVRKVGQKEMTPIGQPVAESKLEEAVGKDLAKKIINGDGEITASGWNRFSGLDLKVGGEGMKAFYDKIVPNVANDVLKKLGGGRVGEFSIDVQGRPETATGLMEVREWTGPDLEAAQVKEIARDDNLPAAVQGQLRDIAERMTAGIPQAQAIREWGSIAAANALGGDLVAKANHMVGQPGFDITPSMREKAMETQALFQPDRGALQFDQQGKMAIALLKSADPSTFLHESGHFFLEVTNDLASQPDAPAAMKQDMQTLYSWFGLKDADTWNNMTLDEKRPYHEQFARGFERYLRDGQAPTPVLKGLFQRFRDWLKAVYQSASQLNVEVSDQVRAVMDRMLAEPQRTEAPPEATRSATPPPPRGGVGEPMGEASVPEGTIKPFAPKTADDPQILEMLRDMATNEAGWAQIGGKWMGKAEKGSGVPNFTTWIPKAEWWNDRPDKKMNEAKFVEAVTKHMTDEKMSPAEKRAVDFLTDIANKRLEAKQLYDDAEWNRIAQEVATEGMDPTTKNVVDADAVSIAMQIDEARVERAAITAADDFDFMAEVREIIDGYKPQQDATAAERGTPTAAKPGTPGPAGQEANTPGADRNAGNQGVIAQQALRMVAENPDLPIATGVDAQGNTTYQKASEYLAEAKAMADLKRQDVGLFELAAQCLLGGGR